MPTKTLTPSDGLDLDNPNQYAKQDGPVECLGLSFANDTERREHYLALLTEKLKDPEFRKIEGFPIGGDEDILELSDPPYYTACPNPFIEEFIEFYGRPYDSAEVYKREPYATDVSEGKSTPIYNAHSYHTKVPHKAIMRYLLHYTNPGDVVFDGFCGTGMTGVAAQLCGDKSAVEALGYKVLADGSVLEEKKYDSGDSEWLKLTMLGARSPIISDLSTIGGFISHSYNTPRREISYFSNINSALKKTTGNLSWVYGTLHNPTENIINTQISKLYEKNVSSYDLGKINYIIWSDVLACNECGGEVVFWDHAVDLEVGKVRDKFICPECATELTKKSADRVWVSTFDEVVGETSKQAKQIPVYINYSVGTKRHEKKPDLYDLALINYIENFSNNYWFPTISLPDGFNTAQPIKSHGLDKVHKFYTPRAQLVPKLPQ